MNYSNSSTRLARQRNVLGKIAPEETVVSLECVRGSMVMRVRKLSTLRQWKAARKVAAILLLITSLLAAGPLQAEMIVSGAAEYRTPGTHANIWGVIIVATGLSACGFACWRRTNEE